MRFCAFRLPMIQISSLTLLARVAQVAHPIVGELHFVVFHQSNGDVIPRCQL